MAIAHGGAAGRGGARASARRQGAVHRLARRRAGGGAGMRLARAGGDGRAGRQGRDARARGRATSRGPWTARCGRAARAPGQARGAVERVYVAREVCRAVRGAAGRSARGGCASATRRPSGRAGGAAGLRAAAGARAASSSEEAVAQGAQLHCGGPMPPAPAGCAGAFYAPAVITGATTARCA